MLEKVTRLIIVAVFTLALISSVFINVNHVMAAGTSGRPGAVLPIMGADGQNVEKLELSCQYPVLSSNAGLNYSYSININYTGGKESKVFNLKASVPDGFGYIITPGYGEGQEIAAIRLDGSRGYPETLKLMVRPYAWKVPAPGDYPVIFEAASGDLKAAIELKAIVTASYDLKMTTPDGRLNTEATAGQENSFTVVVANTGSADIEKVEISCPSKDRPSGWTVTCKPETLDLLKVQDTKEVQVTVKPAEKTIAGDYIITVQAEPEAKNAFANLQIRTTVLTPTIWGWVGVGIVILVVVALAIIFIRFGRR
jgi:uncharacterized membrane protein